MKRQDERQEGPGRERQKRITQKQHRSEQNAGYDEAVRGGPATAPVKLDVTDTTANEEQMSRDERRFDRAARAAVNEVRRRERSAD